MKSFKIILAFVSLFVISGLPAKVYSQTRPVLAQCADQRARTDEHTCMACNIYEEAGAEFTKGKFAVSFVVLNRTRAAGYPNSACGVIWQNVGGVPQFSWTAKPRAILDHGHGEREQWDLSARIAAFMLSIRNDPDYDDLDFTHGALYYHALKQNPWPAKYETGHYGNHRFYVDRRGIKRPTKPYCDLTGMAKIDACPNWYPPVVEAVTIPHDPDAVCVKSFWWDPERLLERNVRLEQANQVHQSSMLGPLQFVLGWFRH